MEAYFAKKFYTNYKHIKLKVKNKKYVWDIRGLISRFNSDATSEIKRKQKNRIN